ncbi:MAG: hypothetical protein HGA36_00155 [Candidatus Moranbacteria bacterium]|nr:hypothetical protein [Candidatus Moranbacteria bacterium]
MKNKQRQKIRGFLWLGIKKSLIYQTPLVLLFAVLFVFCAIFHVKAEDVGKANITEIMDDPIENIEKQKTEWIELHVNEKIEIPASGSAEYKKIKDFYVCAKKDAAENPASFCKNSYPVYSQENVFVANAGQYIIIAKDPAIFKSTYQKLNFDEIILLKSNFNLLGTDDAHLSLSWDGKKTWQERFDYASFSFAREKNHSLERIDAGKSCENFSNWQQSSDVGGTPGSANSAGLALATQSNPAQSVVMGKLTMDENIYENVYANFEIQKKADEKVTWTFGDGHKSYLAKTRHKFETKGIYAASVKVYKGKNNTVQNFTISVESFPHPEFRIVEIVANPEGVDTSNEYLVIQNKSKKKINLKGWSIATGWKDFINHPIRKDLMIEKNKSKKITSEFSSFTLNNAKAKIQLRYPDGKVAHEVKYKSPDKTIADGEVYRKVKSGWAWVGVQKSSAISKQSLKNTSSLLTIEPQAIENTEIQEVKETKAEEVVTVPVEIFENKLISLRNENMKIELLKSTPRVLGAETVREIDGIYFLTSQMPEQQHYATVFLKKLVANFNFKVNISLNYFL